MRRFASFAFILLLFACGLTPAPAHPLKMRWADGHIPAEVTDGGLGNPMPRSNRDVEFDDIYPFCLSHKDAVLCAGHEGKKLPLKTVRVLTAAYDLNFTYRSDTALYGHGHFDYRWENWTRAGVCIDFVLTMSEILADVGESGSDMALQLRTVEGDGHATLRVKTSDAGDVILSVGYGLPLKTVPADWLLAGEISMDGKRTITTEQGYVVDYEFGNFVWTGKK
jgi:hypothetical protein